MGGDLYTYLLPEQIASEAQQHERSRFAALVDTISTEWSSSNTEPDIHRVNNSLKWVAIINCFVTARGAYDSATLNLLSNTILDIILHAREDRFTQVRWCGTLSRILRQYRHKLQITIPWRPLYQLLVEVNLIRSPGYEGVALCAVHGATFCRMVRRARRFFPTEAAQEIWHEFRPLLRDLASNDCFEGLGFTCQFLPTHSLSKKTLTPQDHIAAGNHWNQWAQEWMNVWEAIPHCKFWTSCFLALFSRLCKHDKHRVVDWDSILRRLLSHCLLAIEIPVGGALSSSPVGRRAPRECLALFSGESPPRPKSAAKLLIYLIHPQGGSLPHIATLTEFFENYYHPSNGGQWTHAMAAFLKQLCAVFVKRLAHQHEAEAGSVSERAWGGAISREQRATLTQCLLKLAQRGQYSKSSALSNVSKTVFGVLAYVEPPLVLPLVVARFEEALETVTATHQLVSALDSLAACTRPLLLSPGSLPEGVAAHTLLAQALMATLPGIDANDPPKTLAVLKLYCAMLSSLGEVCEEDSEDALHMCFPEWLDLLLDRLFTLFSNLDQPVAHRTTGGDAGSASSDPEVSFLMYGSSMYRPFMELLFARLSVRLYDGALERVSGFLRSHTLPGAASELGVLTAAAVWACPEKALKELLLPLAARILDEAALLLHMPTSPRKDDQAAPLLVLTIGQETSFRWWIGILTAGAHYAGAALVPHQAVLLQVLDVCFQLAQRTSSLALGEAASQLLSSLLCTLLTYYPCDQYKVSDSGDSDMGEPSSSSSPGPEAWMVGGGKSAVRAAGEVQWHVPSQPEIQLAEKLLDLYLEQPVLHLQEVCREAAMETESSEASSSGGGGGGGTGGLQTTGTQSDQRKQRVRVLLLQVEGALGARTSLRDFQPEPNQEPDCPWLLAGQAGAQVGRPQLRERVAGVVHTLLQQQVTQDPETLLLLLRVLDDLLGHGRRDFADWQHSLHAWRTDASLLTQPKVAGILEGAGQQCEDSDSSDDEEEMEMENENVAEDKSVASGCPPGDSSDSGGIKLSCQKARPRWLVLERVYLTNQWRTSQVAYFTGMPNRTAPPPNSAYWVLVGDLHQLLLHRYKAVRLYAGPVLERCLKRYPSIAPAFLPKLLGALTEPPVADNKEEAALGACLALSGRVMSRYNTRDPQALVSMIMAILSTSHHNTLKVQAAISDFFMVLTLRFSRVALYRSDGEVGGPIDSACERLLEVLSSSESPPPASTATSTSTSSPEGPAAEASLPAVTTIGEGNGNGGGTQQPLHWRYTLMAAALLLFLQSPRRTPLESHRARTVSLLLSSARSSLAPLRPLSLVTLLLLLREAGSVPEPLLAGGSSSVTEEGGAVVPYRRKLQLDRQAMHSEGVLIASQVVRDQLDSSSLAEMIQMCALNHSQSSSDSQAGGSNSMHGGDNVQRAALSSVAGREWPRRKGGMSGGRFSLVHARVFKSLVKAGGAPLVQHLRPGLTAAATSQDRPNQCAAAEVFAGLLRATKLDPPSDPPSTSHSAATHPSTSASADWEEWIRPLLQQNLRDTPNDLLPEWTTAIRYAVSGACPSGLATRREIMRLLVEPVPPGSTSGLEVKRLAYLSGALLEMAGRQGEDLVSVPLLQELQDLLQHPSRQVREEMASCAAVICGTLSRTSLQDKGWQEAVEKFVSRVNESAEADSFLVVAKETELGPEVSDNTATANDSADAMDTSSSKAESEAAVKSATCRLETCMFWVISLIKGGDASALLPSLLPLLGPLLRVQELPDRDFATIAKRTLAYFKYVPIPTPLLPRVTGILKQATQSPLWHTRAATINFIQAFVYRQHFGLGSEERGVLQGAVMELLSDPQLEVREVAATTVAGLLKADPGFHQTLQTWASASAQKALEEAKLERKQAKRNRLAAASQASSSPKTTPTMTLAQRHGAILGLSALVLSSPYDVPPWLPDVLICLAGASQEPPPIRDTVTKTLADFKKTHHDTWAQTRAAFQEHQWDAFMDLSLSPSYFA